MRRAFLILPLALIAPSASAQTGTISGTVRNAATRAPLEGVLIRVEGTSYGSFSHANGDFTILGVPPGTYAVSARRFGFARAEFVNVEIQIGRTRTLRFGLTPSQSDSTARVEFMPAVVDSTIGRITNSVNNDMLVALPTMNLSGALGLGGAYLDLPRTTATLSTTDVQRGIISLASIRGARPEATRYLVDGVDVANPVFGSLPLLIEPLAVAGVTVSPAHADPEDGSAASGLVSQSVREGGRRVNGAFEYQSGAIAGRFSPPASAAASAYGARGYLSGPVPYTRDALQFMIAGHRTNERVAVTRLGTAPWQGAGDAQDIQFVGKLTYTMRPSVRLAVLGVHQRRAATSTDTIPLSGDTVAIPSVNDVTRLFSVRAEKRFSRGSLSLTWSQLSGDRLTCSFWQGVCITDRFARIPEGDEVPAFGAPTRQQPYMQSGQFFGGETYRTRALRADLIALASDHHEVRVGAVATRHRVSYADEYGYRWLQGIVLTERDAFRARPTEFATYVQDAIQHDLMTVHFGARFEYGNAGGVAFVNPADPTNGTTAREVCDGRAPGLSETPWTYGNQSGMAACMNSPLNADVRPTLLDSATRVAQSDDFKRVRPRAVFAPRIAVSFPLSEQSGMFLDAGRYARNPLYTHTYRNTGTGTRAGDGPGDDGLCSDLRARIGSDECSPMIGLESRVPTFIGNPDLNFEIADGIEAGFTTRFARTRSIEVSTFMMTQSWLPRAYLRSHPIDIGGTYGVFTEGVTRLIVGTGSGTGFGISATIRQQRRRVLSYTINYTMLKSDEIGAPPELAAEALATNRFFEDRIERLSSRGRGQSVNALVSMHWSTNVPVPLGPLGATLLRNSRTSVTLFKATSSETRSRPSQGAGATSNFDQDIIGTGTLISLLYMKTLNTRGARWALVARVRNLLDADDGSRAIQRGAEVSRRRVLTGMSVVF